MFQFTKYNMAAVISLKCMGWGRGAETRKTKRFSATRIRTCILHNLAGFVRGLSVYLSLYQRPNGQDPFYIRKVNIFMWSYFYLLGLHTCKTISLMTHWSSPFLYYPSMKPLTLAIGYDRLKSVLLYISSCGH